MVLLCQTLGVPANCAAGEGETLLRVTFQVQAAILKAQAVVLGTFSSQRVRPDPFLLNAQHVKPTVQT